MSSQVGAYLLENINDRNISVNLSNPDHTFFIEIRDKEAFLFKEVIHGVSGLPYGSQGKLISLFSGGIDSPIASWLMMKRGCDIIPLFCDLTPYNTEAAYSRAVKVLQKLSEYSPLKKLLLFRAPHGFILEQLKGVIHPKNTCLMCKRIMYRIAERLATQLNAKGIVTGENLGQVASQTLDNLFILNQSVRIPVFRPLIGFDKIEVITLSKYPETHGSLDEILALEKDVAIESLIDKAFQNIQSIELSLSNKKIEN
ncbi:MAG: tRNA sulfurtransferase [Candidatus Helarchaeota archaeon]